MKKCKNCNKKINKQKKFCNNSCSAIFNNKNRILSNKTKIKIKNKLLKNFHKSNIIGDFTNIRYYSCSICKNIFCYKRKKKTCSKKCLKVILKENARKAGLESSKKQVRRSKNEIKLFELLSQNYKCKHNENIFNGWDADIIIKDLKLAILWNGIWHYKELNFQNHSLRQVQIRDDIKIKEILNKNWNYLIIKDFNPKIKPKEAYDKIMESIENKEFNKIIGN